MSSLHARPPYSRDELERLYPKRLRLQLIQVVSHYPTWRRPPSSTAVDAKAGAFHLLRFAVIQAKPFLVSPTWGEDSYSCKIRKFWPYCNFARNLVNVVLADDDDGSSWEGLKWRRRLETFGNGDSPTRASGPNDQTDALCGLGELTDQGRRTALDLGRRLRHLYVHQIRFLPEVIADDATIYMRASPFSRALESVQQAFLGLYPSRARAAAFPGPTIYMRNPAEETLLPNEDYCARFIQMSKAYARNTTREMDYLNRLMQKWMPSGQRVAVDSSPPLAGIFDSINATLATPSPHTRLPQEFYDAKARAIIDRIAVEEEYSAYKESSEFRTLGIGALLGDIVQRMVGNVEACGGTRGLAGFDETFSRTVDGGGGSDEQDRGWKFALSGCHDSTLAAILASLGALEGENGTWPSYCSSLAVELFSETNSLPQTSTAALSQKRSGAADPAGPPVGDSSVYRTPTSQLGDQQRRNLNGYYARFKGIVDKFTPTNWKHACVSNLDKSPFPADKEPAGF
ncbi:MAG: hypothetical protein M1816_004689 [Peltula sp. TS41687]|nr:MAG: hypothetical protein M1816_004689 [Peltula sp. TS41687]